MRLCRHNDIEVVASGRKFVLLMLVAENEDSSL